MADSMMEGYVKSAALAAMFSAPFLEGVVELLTALGFAFEEGDAAALTHATQAVAWEIKNECGVPAVPEGLYPCAQGLIAAQFLMEKKNTGRLNGLDLREEPAVKSIAEGDTSVVFASEGVQSGDERMDALIKGWRDARAQLAAYRRLKW